MSTTDTPRSTYDPRYATSRPGSTSMSDICDPTMRPFEPMRSRRYRYSAAADPVESTTNTTPAKTANGSALILLTLRKTEGACGIKGSRTAPANKYHSRERESTIFTPSSVSVPVEAGRHKAKVVIVGGTAVGKRSLVHRSAFDPVSDRFVTTLGAKVSKKEIVLPVRLRDGTFIDLILWTVNPRAVTKRESALVRGTSAILAVCDSTRMQTLEELDGLMRTVREAAADGPAVIAVNKWDLSGERQIQPDDALAFAKAHAVDSFFTSATTGENVEAVFQALVEQVVRHLRVESQDIEKG